MDDAVLTRPGALLVALLVAGLGGCAFYSPDVVDCSVRCGENDACPSGTECREGFCRKPDATNRCDCKPGDSRPCGGGKGECNQGLQTCTENGAWTACLGEGKPTEERCDGKDNNCDGVVDNSVADPPLCERSQGVCAQGRQTCVSGSFQACSVADYGPFFEEIEVSCDGLDNDCDGYVDSTPPATLATGVTSEFAFLAEPAGFAAVFADAAGVEVARFDQALVKQATVLVEAGTQPQMLGAAIDGADVYVVWSVNGAISAAHVSPSMSAPEPLPGLPSAGASNRLHVGARAGELVAGFLADGDTRAELAVWPLDGGAPSVTTLNEADGGLWTDGQLDDMTVSASGNYAMWTGSYVDDPDAGTTASVYRTVSAKPPFTTVSSSAYTRNGTLAEDGSRLTYSYTYSFFSIIPLIDSYSGVGFKKNLLVNNDGVDVQRVDKESDVFAGAHAISIGGQMILAYMNKQTSRIVLASESRSGTTTIFRVRDAATNGGFGVPRLAATSSYIALAWEQNGTLSAQRSCAP